MDVAGTSGLLAALALVAAPMLWLWWRAPRPAKDLAPMLGGRWEPVQFRPGPAPLPEHDAATIAARMKADRARAALAPEPPPAPAPTVRRLHALEQLVAPAIADDSSPQAAGEPVSAVA
jgi:hypothetical protein